ncbi:M48 family metalloprotease [Nocardioides sp. CCNWLW239]|uniref:M48 family metalloprotease n=1 Tax=Nocardioides sp. CCNWLW239 TaxID=3128902 RepID=UPI003018BA92
MSDRTAALSVGSRPERDPFRYPSGTTVRFGVLVLSAVSLGVPAISERVASLPGFLRGEFAGTATRNHQVHDCYARLYQNGEEDPSAFAACGVVSPVPLWVFAVALAGFVVVVLAVYWLIPVLRVRRRGYVAIPYADLRAELDGLREMAGVGHEIRWLIDPANPRPEALAFGRIGRRYIMLSAGVVALRSRQPAAFRTIVLHELAHLRNRDVDLAYLAIAVWRVTMPIAALEVFGSVFAPLVYSSNPGQLIAGSVGAVQTILLIVMVPILRNGLLRTRELYADARVRLWTSSDEVDDFFSTHAAAAPRGRRRRRALSTHPDLGVRRAALRDDSRLFQVRIAEAFATGLVFGIFYTQIIRISDFRPNSEETTWSFVAVRVVAVLLVGVWSIAALRALQTSPADRRGSAMIPSAVGLGLGWSLGAGVLNLDVAWNLYNVRFGVLGLCCWVLASVGLAIVGSRYVHSVIRTWFHPGDDSRPRGAWLGPAAIALGLVLVVSGVLAPHSISELATISFAYAFPGHAVIYLLEGPIFVLCNLLVVWITWRSVALGAAAWVVLLIVNSRRARRARALR